MIHKIKALHNEGAGLSIRSIARELGISRNTVRKYLRMDEVAIGEQQANRTRRKQLDDYRDYIVTLLGQFPGLSAVKVLRKLKERHPELGVSDRSARRYIKALKETVSLRQKRYYEPVESPPGVQCQVDGGELRGLSVGGEATTVHFVVFVLSYSRLMYVGLSPRPIDTATFIRLHDAAFRYFGGRPEECVYDQTKLVVLHEQYRELDPNPAFAAYATAAGFRIYACEGYDPESKGKVEAGVKYVKGNALAGEVFDDRDHLEAHVRQWLDGVANVRQHGTTGARLCAQLKATSPRIHKDQLVALRGLLRQHTDLPQTLLDQLIERPALTTSQCRAYSEAYAADPGRFVDPPAAPPASPTPPPPTDGSDRLSGYAAVLPSVQEVTCGLH